MNSVLRLMLLGLACFAATVLVLLVLNSAILAVAPCYQTNTCSQTPVLATVAYGLDAIKHVAYFAFFPLGTILGRRDFRKGFSSRLHRRIARIAFALIPVSLLPIQPFFTVSLF